MFTFEDLLAVAEEEKEFPRTPGGLDKDDNCAPRFEGPARKKKEELKESRFLQIHVPFTRVGFETRCLKEKDWRDWARCGSRSRSDPVAQAKKEETKRGLASVFFFFLSLARKLGIRRKSWY